MTKQPDDKSDLPVHKQLDELHWAIEGDGFGYRAHFESHGRVLRSEVRHSERPGVSGATCELLTPNGWVEVYSVPPPELVYWRKNDARPEKQCSHEAARTDARRMAYEAGRLFLKTEPEQDALSLQFATVAMAALAELSGTEDTWINDSNIRVIDQQLNYIASGEFKGKALDSEGMQVHARLAQAALLTLKHQRAKS